MKRKKHKNNRRHKTSGNPKRKQKKSPLVKRGINMPGIWEVVIGIALLLAGAGLGYFTGNPKILYIGALGVCVLVFYATHRLVLHLESAKIATPKVVYFGGLTPGNEPVEPLPPGIPADTVQLILGDNIRIFSSSHNPVLSKDGKGTKRGRELLEESLER